jgi:alanine dehydrogenase
VLVGTGDGDASSIADEPHQDRASVLVTATRALSNALLPYAREVTVRDLADALNSDAGFGPGVDFPAGRVVDPVLAPATGTEHDLLSVLPLHSEAR